MRVNALILLTTTTLATAAPVAQLDTALGQLGAAIPQPGEDPASSIPDLTGALGSAVNAIPQPPPSRRQLSAALGQLGAAIPQPGEDPAASIPDLTGALGSAVNAIPGAAGSGGKRARRQLDAALGQLTDAIPRPGEDPAGSIPDLTDALGSAVNAIPGANNGGA